MDPFYSLLCVLGISSFVGTDTQPSVDFISQLPAEIAVKILGLLDGESLLAAAAVSPSWLALCRGTRRLRARGRRQVQRRGLGALHSLQAVAARARPALRPPGPAVAFAPVNARMRALQPARSPARDAAPAPAQAPAPAPAPRPTAPVASQKGAAVRFPRRLRAGTQSPAAAPARQRPGRRRDRAAACAAPAAKRMRL